MDKRNRRIESLAARWMAARATDAEEQELRRLLRSGEVPESLRDLAALFEGLGALSGERMPDTGAAGRPAADSSCRKLPRAETRPLHRLAAVWWGMAAAVVAGILVLAGLVREPYCYIDGRPVYDREVALQTTAYLDSFAALDATSQIVDELMENK